MLEEEPRLPGRSEQLIDGFVAWSGLADEPRRYTKTAAVLGVFIAAILGIAYFADGCEKKAVIARTPVPAGAVTQTGAPAPAGSDCGSSLPPGNSAGHLCAMKASCHWGTACVDQFDTATSICDCICP